MTLFTASSGGRLTMRLSFSMVAAASGRTTFSISNGCLLFDTAVRSASVSAANGPRRKAVRLEPSGAWAAESIFGLEGDNRISGLAVGPADATALAGSFTGSVTLGGATRAAVGAADVFVYRPAE